MKKINLTITGCLGRMGQELIKSSKRERKILNFFQLLKTKLLIKRYMV